MHQNLPDCLRSAASQEGQAVCDQLHIPGGFGVPVGCRAWGSLQVTLGCRTSAPGTNTTGFVINDL